MIWLYVKVEKDEDHFSFLAVLGLSSTFIAEGFWMFKEEAFYCVGCIEFLSGAMFIGISSLVNVFKEKRMGKVMPGSSRNLFVLSVILFCMSVVLAEINVYICYSSKNSRKHPTCIS